MSTENTASNLPANTEPAPEASASAPSTEDTNAEADPLDELKDIDFLLEDIEDKIAPLALSPGI